MSEVSASWPVPPPSKNEDWIRCFFNVHEKLTEGPKSPLPLCSARGKSMKSSTVRDHCYVKPGLHCRKLSVNFKTLTISMKTFIWWACGGDWWFGESPAVRIEVRLSVEAGMMFRPLAVGGGRAVTPLIRPSPVTANGRPRPRSVGR